jgi:hypothetical protein
LLLFLLAGRNNDILGFGARFGGGVVSLLCSTVVMTGTTFSFSSTGSIISFISKAFCNLPLPHEFVPFFSSRSTGTSGATAATRDGG